MHVVPVSQLRAAYSEPVDRLRAIGRVAVFTREEWPDYVAEFGLGSDHVGELIRMAGDPSLLDGDPDADPDVWAGLHAWRALGQLRAEAAIVPLIGLLQSLDDDAAMNELPTVLGMIGPAAIAPLTDFLADPAQTTYNAAAAMDALNHVAQFHPQLRDDCVGIVARQLESTARHDPDTLGYAVCTLIDLAAVEAIHAIRAAFARDAIEMSIPGDLEDVEISLGLREQRETPKPRYRHRWWNQGGVDADEFWSRPVQEPVRSVKIGRNAPCPCGSGAKYKKCCLV